MFVLIDNQVIAPSLRHRYGHDFIGENTIADRNLGTLLAAQGELVLSVT